MYAALIIVSALPVETQQLIINGHGLYVESYRGDASAPMAILLHHGLGSSAAWKFTIRSLLEAGWQIINYDRWGYGASGDRPGLSIPDFHEDIADLFSVVTQMWGRQVCLIGHSDGGTIGAYFAARYPDLVCCFISVAAHIYVEPKMETGILAVKKSFDEDVRFRNSLQRVHGDRYHQVFMDWFNGWLTPKNLSWDIRSELSLIRCPVLVIQGEQDEHATPTHASNMVEAITGADLYMVPGGRHMFPQENPDVFNQLVLRFLEKKCLIKS